MVKNNAHVVFYNLAWFITSPAIAIFRKNKGIMKTKRNYQINEAGILLLIKIELKSYRFFNVLRTIGLDDAFYQPDLCDFILSHFNLNTEVNEILDFYYHLFEKYSQRVEENPKVIEKLARQVFAELNKKAAKGK